MPVPGVPGERFHLVKFHARRPGRGLPGPRRCPGICAVAVKQILPEHADNPAYQADFLDQAHLTGLLEHPGVVPVDRLGTHPDGRPFYAMGFIEGENLRVARARDPQPRAARIISAAWRCAGLLRRASSRCATPWRSRICGIIHRVVLNRTTSGWASTARPWSSIGVWPGSSTRTKVKNWRETVLLETGTIAGQVKGTPSYMAPEQAAGGRISVPPATSTAWS